MADERKRYSRDEQTGKLFEIVPEKKLDTTFAIVSFVYLGLALGFSLWLLFDTWAQKYTLVRWLGYTDVQAHLSKPIFRSFSYAFIGGALGGIIAGYRSCIYWHSEQRAFGWQFVWRYVFFPWLGGTLAVFVYAIIGSGVAVVGGTVNFGVTNMLLALAIGSLVGYGSPQVIRWLDSQVNTVFKVAAAPEVQVPDLIGLTPQEAGKKLAEAGLKIDQVIKKHEEGKEVGKVIEQEPPAGSMAPTGGLVKLTIAAAHSAEVEGEKHNEGGTS